MLVEVLQVARNVMAHVIRRREHFHELVHHLVGLGTVVLRVVADVDVQRDAVQFRPGVDGQVRFGQHHGAGDTAAIELVEKITQAGELGCLDGIETDAPQGVPVGQEARITPAAVQVGDKMKTVQFA